MTSHERFTRRFRIEDPLPGHFEGVRVQVRDIAERGVQIEHTEALTRGSSGFLEYTIPGRQKPIEVHGQIRWTRSFPTGPSKYIYRSGILVDGNVDTLNSSIDLMLRKGIARLDRTPAQTEEGASPASPTTGFAFAGAEAPLSLPRMEPVGEISPQVVRLVEQARERLASSFDDSVKWYNRARYSLSDATVQREADGIHHKEDVLAVWEFLDRKVDIATIARVFDVSH
jgi:hypothetical protein